MYHQVSRSQSNAQIKLTQVKTSYGVHYMMQFYRTTMLYVSHYSLVCDVACRCMLNSSQGTLPFAAFFQASHLHPFEQSPSLPGFSLFTHKKECSALAIPMTPGWSITSICHVFGIDFKL